MIDISTITSIIIILAKPIYKHLYPAQQKAFNKAKKRWCKNDDIRLRVFFNKFYDLNKFIKNTPNYEKTLNSEEALFIDFYINELLEDKETGLIIKNCLDKLRKEQLSTEIKIGNNDIKNEIQSSKKEIISEIKLFKDELEIKIKDHLSTSKIPLNTYYYPKDYIERNIQESNNDFLYSKSKKLYENIIDSEENLFILYSEPQLGKTTEMENLAYKLQKSELFQPCLFSLKSYKTDKLKNQLSERIDLNNDKTFLILDGLDETSNIDRSRIIKEIEEIAKSYNNISIIVSCRENFKATSGLDHFKKLYLTSLTQKEAYTYISNESTDSKDIIHKFKEIEFESFMFSPFYLKSIIKYYNDNKKILPKNKTELYDYFISESFSLNEHNPKNRGNIIPKKDENKAILTKIAFCLCVTEKQEITTTELKNKLNFKDIDIKMCCDFSILKKEKEKIFFAHSTFKEFLTAKFLKSKSFKELKPYICLTNTERLNPSWYNVIMLLIGILEEDNKLLDPLITWLEKNEKELLINSDTHFINIDKKTHIFKAFFEDYKNFSEQKNSNIESKLANFGDPNEISEYLYSEISNPPKNETESKYLMNFAFEIISKLNWLYLNTKNKKNLETLLFNHLKLTKLDYKNKYPFIYNFDNEYFYT
ncbi:MAG: hypothetical protein IMY73_03970, partial [Bacteroidetes bacterium]|nr:hypothetical protein [Bacteroidota bacterium]